jgi:cob(I)alamin adenosyltransferase
MSIMTKRGDDGKTDLLYGHRIAKTSQRVETLGAIDELNASIGLARCHSETKLAEELDWLQERLVGLMGELATLPENLARYEGDGMPQISAADVATLEERGKAIEEAGVSFKGWARPGASGSQTAAFLDRARTVGRRAVRAVLTLQVEGEAEVPKVALFLNRLSDYLWLLARREES